MNNLTKNNIIKALTASNNLSLLNELPILEKPYTLMLREFNEGIRIYTQSTFGELESYDENMNVCGSPMCIAGHLVNYAKSQGYETKNRYGWNSAATIIHLKAHPNTPVFNFNLTENSLGLAYIEMMARFENRENQDESFDRFIENQLAMN